MIQALILIVLCIAFWPAILSFLAVVTVAAIAIITEFWILIVTIIGLAVLAGIIQALQSNNN